MNKLYVLSFEDELDDDTLEALFEEATESGVELVHAFDDNYKALVSLPTEIPEDDFEEYWKAVFFEILDCCCDPKTYINPLEVYSIKTLDEFRRNDLELNPEMGGNYISELADYSD